MGEALPRVARVHEQTVQAVAAGDAELAGRRRSHARRTTSAYEVVTTRVDPKLWAVALDLADGDPRRIEICSAAEVIVR